MEARGILQPRYIGQVTYNADGQPVTPIIYGDFPTPEGGTVFRCFNYPDADGVVDLERDTDGVWRSARS